MRLKFLTLDDKQYSVILEDYKTNILKKSASDFQFKWKEFFIKIFPYDFWAEEFPIRPLLKHKYRLDLFNFSRQFAVEMHGAGHTKAVSIWHKTHKDFLDAMLRDREKELTCDKNNIKLIKVYPSTPMDIDWFRKKYTNIKWPSKI